MIISASYKTDIPAFYGEWLMNRINDGYCKAFNPYSNQAYTVRLAKNYVDGFVFWSKNIIPFLDNLEKIKSKGYPFIIHHTVNNYPKELEKIENTSDEIIEVLKDLNNKNSIDTIIWRYDPILFSSLTPKEFHIANFKEMAIKLNGVVNEVTVSFAQLYKKTRTNLDKIKSDKFSWRDPSVSEKQGLLRELSFIARKNRMELSLCAQPALMIPEVKKAHCVDAERLGKVANKKMLVAEKPNRPGCGCAKSIDIGYYNTCAHGCIYCYANDNPDLASNNYKNHDPNCEFLFEDK